MTAMRTRPPVLAVVTASVSLLLGACTSGDDPQQEAPTSVQNGPDGEQPTDGPAEDGDADAAGSTAPPAERGFLCRYVTEATQEVLAGGDLTDPYQLMVQNDPQSWVCEVRDEDEALVRVSILRGEGVWDTQRDLAEAEQGVTEAPPWLGESYQSSRRITGLTMCTLAQEGGGTYEPYALVVEAVSDSTEDVTGELSTTASALARSLDQAIGCSPRMARGEIEGPTP